MHARQEQGQSVWGGGMVRTSGWKVWGCFHSQRCRFAGRVVSALWSKALILQGKVQGGPGTAAGAALTIINKRPLTLKSMPPTNDEHKNSMPRPPTADAKWKGKLLRPRPRSHARWVGSAEFYVRRNSATLRIYAAYTGSPCPVAKQATIPG